MRLRLQNHEFLKFGGQLYRLENAKRNALDLTEFQNQVQYKNFLREQVIDSSLKKKKNRLILTDLVIMYTRFGNSQPPVSLEITTIASLTRETSAMILKKLLKKELTYSSNTF